MAAGLANRAARDRAATLAIVGARPEVVNESAAGDEDDDSW
jgi:hypothetical protein